MNISVHLLGPDVSYCKPVSGPGKTTVRYTGHSLAVRKKKYLCARYVGFSLTLSPHIAQYFLHFMGF
jgi:hypothetical protein